MAQTGPRDAMRLVWGAAINRAVHGAARVVTASCLVARGRLHGAAGPRTAASMGPSAHVGPTLNRAPPLPHRGVVGRAEEHLVGPRAHARHAVRMSAQLALAPLLLPHPPATAPSPTRPALLSNVDAAQLSLFDQAVVGSGVEMLPDQTQTEYGRRMATKDRRATRLGGCFIPHAHCRIS